jgi:hypothetical protein
LQNLGADQLGGVWPKRRCSPPRFEALYSLLPNAETRNLQVCEAFVSRVGNSPSSARWNPVPFTVREDCHLEDSLRALELASLFSCRSPPTETVKTEYERRWNSFSPLCLNLKMPLVGLEALAFFHEGGYHISRRNTSSSRNPGTRVLSLRPVRISTLRLTTRQEYRGNMLSAALINKRLQLNLVWYLWCMTLHAHDPRASFSR